MIAKKYKIKVIEDCAQAQGAKYKKKFVGTLGDIGCFSFYPTKILGAYGDGGFILTKTFGDFSMVRRLRYYGIETVNKKDALFNKYYANINGYNSRLDEIQCCILNIKLKHVEKFINKRINFANYYLQQLKGTSLKLPMVNDYNKHVFHLFTVYHPKRDKIIKLLQKQKIEVRVIYPYPINTMKAYSKFHKNKITVLNSYKYSKGIFSLPLYPEMEVREINKICRALNKILKKIDT